MNSNSNANGGGGRQTPRQGSAQLGDDSVVHDGVMQTHLAFPTAYSPMSFYQPYYEYPTAAIQQQRMEIDMLTAAAHLQQQQLDFERTRAAISAAQVLRGRVGGILPEDLPGMMEDEARLQSQSALFPPTISSLPSHLGYNVFSTMAPSVSPATVRMMINGDHNASNLIPVLPQFSALPTSIGTDITLLEDSGQQLNHQVNGLEMDQPISISTFSSMAPSKTPCTKLEGVTEFRFSDAISITDASKKASLFQSDEVTQKDESPIGDVLSRLETLPGESNNPPNVFGKKKAKAKSETAVNARIKKSCPSDINLTPQAASTASKKTSSTLSRSKVGKSTISPFYSSNRLLLQTGIQPALSDPAPNLTDAEYMNLDALMTQFCSVPYLTEFCRPLSILHPDMISSYSKVIRQPIDLGMVCRRIHHRMYRTGRAVCLDVWRVFSNCIKFHTHQSTRDLSVPSFVSIAVHLSEYFTSLWLEYMLPSDSPNFPSIYHSDSLDHAVDGAHADDWTLIQHLRQRDPYVKALKNAFEVRECRRLTRISVLGPTTFLTQKTLMKVSNFINTLVNTGGCLDVLDTNLITAVKGTMNEEIVNPNIFSILEQCFNSLRKLSEKLESFASIDSDPESNGSNVPEYSINDLYNDLMECYTPTTVHRNLSIMILARLHRLLGKITAPIYEINNRGVNQSSVWGCSAAVIWARENAKRPYWPAIVIGVLAPDDQKEPWHQILTAVNETRLPEKLRAELSIGKKKAEVAIQKQSIGSAERMSYFLVEFLGSHEFIWVREADIIEKFDPCEDPNSDSGDGSGGRKKKNATRSQTPTNMKSFQKGVEEGQWALEELDMQMTDPCGDMSQNYYEPNQECSCSYASMRNSSVVSDSSDTEGYIIESVSDVATSASPPGGMLTDLEEINELLATNGLIDYSVDGRKTAKKRSLAMKRFDSESKRVLLKRDKCDHEKKLSSGHQSKNKDNVNLGLIPRSIGKGKIDGDKERSKIECSRDDKDLLKRRKKRERERERILKDADRKLKKQRTDSGIVADIDRQSGIVDKIGRARAVIRGYLHRLTTQEEVCNILCVDGMSSVSMQSIESSSLIGLAVTFRAVAGELDVPSTGDFITPIKPWDKINAETPRSSDDRCQCLEKKIALVEKAVEALRENNKRRKALIEAALSDRDIVSFKIYSEQNRALKLFDAAENKQVKMADSSSVEEVTATEE